MPYIVRDLHKNGQEEQDYNEFLTLQVELADAAHPHIIKVIGVGGGGGNAVSNMYVEGIDGVQFLVCNTDAKALSDSPIPNRLQLGIGLGAGGDPSVGRKIALEHIDEINAALSSHIKMVFVTAGMGGGTGTGAAPVIAKCAKEKGILTIGVVTIPFIFEGRKKIDKAIDGVEELASSVDAMLIINNERLREIYSNLTILNAFKKADLTLLTAVRSIVEIIQMRGKMILDFQDVTNCLKEGGMAIMSSGYGMGENRISKAIQQAITSPLLNNKDLFKASRLLINITTSDEEKWMMTMSESNELENFIHKFDSSVSVKYGLTTHKDMKENVKITLLASGFKLDDHDRNNFRGDTLMTKEEEERLQRREKFYPGGQTVYRRAPALVYRLGLDDLENESLIQALDESPTYLRSRDEYNRLLKLSAPPSATVIDLSGPLK